MENIIIVSFDIESEGYQAITELKKNVWRSSARSPLWWDQRV